MVYCTKCGTLNADDATVCTNCGAPIQGTRSEGGSYATRWRWEREYHTYPRRGGALAMLAIGLIIALIGLGSILATAYGITIPWGAIILIFIGVLIIVAGIRGRRMWNRS